MCRSILSFISGCLVKLFLFLEVVTVALCSVTLVFGANVVVVSGLTSSVTVSFVSTISVVLIGVQCTVGWSVSSVLFSVLFKLCVSFVSVGDVSVVLAIVSGVLVVEAVGVVLVKYMARPCRSECRIVEGSMSVEGSDSVCGNAIASPLPTGIEENGDIS